MAYTEIWDETKPAGTRDANLGDDDIREFKRSIRERLANGGQYFPSTDDADAGLYKYVYFIEQSGNPTAASNRGFLFTKDVSGITELYWMDSAGTVIQLTTGGKILITSLAIASEAQGDVLYRGASAWSRLGAGTSGQFLKTQGAAANPAWADAGFQTAASQAEMEAASLNTVPVTPGRAQYHPGMAKAWVNFVGASGVIAASHNIASVVRNSQGNYTITFTTAFSSASYCMVAMTRENAGTTPTVVNIHPTTDPIASAMTVRAFDVSNTLIDPGTVCLAFFGDQ